MIYLSKDINDPLWMCLTFYYCQLIFVFYFLQIERPHELGTVEEKTNLVNKDGNDETDV